MLGVIAVVGCGARGASSGADAGPGPDAAIAAPPADASSLVEDSGAASVTPGDGRPALGITAFVATVYREPRDTSRKLGYLRLGAIVPRSAEPVGKVGCPGGWYEVAPKGFVCAGPEATTDLSTPMLRAASRRPNLATALPYHYAFVRAVLPLYLRVPTAEQQYKAEFKLKEHLDWFSENAQQVSKVTLGANDVPIDARGVPINNKKLGELGLGKNSTEQSLGATLGGSGDDDPIPFWLANGQRAIPNVSDFAVPDYSVFADRARRHTGLALVGSFATGPDTLQRRFAVTTDMRLAPASKIKADTGSPWHGLELDDAMTLPLAFVRAQGARAYKITHGKVTPSGEMDFRSAHALTGKMRTVDGVKYYRTNDKFWVKQTDVGLAIAPASFPDDANQGKKWVEISIGAQTLVLWEGNKPVYATLISSGQAGIDDPKKTTATVRGVFKIRNKHITATMDSNESSSVGGRANTTAPRDKGSDAGDKPPVKNSAQTKSSGAKGASAQEGDHDAKKPRRGDGEYGVTKRRGEGSFVLRDVPYIQYFESGYALHAAYWHDVFGTPRSHGCVNLAPVDAHRVFAWTDPQVPEGWHAVNAGEDFGEGTTVVIHE
jgi:lipoprotein-anchoring transpeptidase ErfK/SrfK